MWLIKGHFPFFPPFTCEWRWPLQWRERKIMRKRKGLEGPEEDWHFPENAWMSVPALLFPSFLVHEQTDLEDSVSSSVKQRWWYQSLLRYNALLRFKWCNHNCGIIVVGASWPTILKSPLINCTEVLEGIQEILKTKVHYCHESRIVS